MEKLTIQVTDCGERTGETLELSTDRGPHAYLQLGGELPQDHSYARLTVDQAERVGAWLLEWARAAK